MLKSLVELATLITLINVLFVLTMVLTGCGETHIHHMVEPVYDEIDPVAPTPEPVIPQPVVEPDYNPFSNTLNSIESTFETLERDFIIIAAMPHGLDIIGILLESIPVERKAAKVFALPSSKAKTMMLQAGVDHIDTITKLSGLFTALSSKPGSKAQKTVKDIKPKPEPEESDDTNIIGTIIRAVSG